jgi:hypothetical protein
VPSEKAKSLAILALLALSGCAGPHAYDRGRLAKPKMQLDPDPDAALIEQHVYEYREGSAGGYSGGGGGCGCN